MKHGIGSPAADTDGKVVKMHSQRRLYASVTLFRATYLRLHAGRRVRVSTRQATAIHKAVKVSFGL